MQSGQQAAQVVPINQKNAASVSERAKLARLPAPVHQVREKGKQCLQKALHQVFDNADDALFTLADKATNNHEQNIYFESMREVRIRRRHMEAKFETAIDEAFAKLLSSNDKKGESAEYLADQDISVDQLSLVQNDDLEELVAVDSMVNKANTACGENLQYLSLRLDSLVPNKVYQKNNPLGPQIICQSFISTAKDLDADIKAKLVLFKLFDQHVVSQLPSIHAILNQTLIELDVLPSIQNPRTTSSYAPQPNRGSGRRVNVSPNMTTEESVAAAEDTLNALRGLMHSQAAPSGMPLAGAAGANQQGQAYSHNPASGGHSGGQTAPVAGDELLGVLSQLQGQQQSTWGSQAAPTVSSIQTDVNAYIAQLFQAQGQNRQVGPVENDVINLVKMLFEFILDDRNLAAPLKAIIGRLQIPILKVALLDKTFFSKAGHPARRLLNEMATASLGWQEDPSNEGVPKDPLYKKIDSIVQTLLSDFESDTGVFTDLLTDFVAFIDRERRRASVLERRTLDAEDGKAKAEAARKKVSEALVSIIGDKELPSSVQRILNDAWSNVLFLLCLRKGTSSEDWNKALSTAKELVWSVTVPIDQKSRGQLLALIPRIVKNLREGLEKISFNPFEMTQLLGQLEKIHMQRLKAPKESQQPTPDAQNSLQAIKPVQVSPNAKPVAEVEPKPPQTKAKPISNDLQKAPSNSAKAVTPIKPKMAEVTPSESSDKPKPASTRPTISTEGSKLVSAEDAKAIDSIDESYLALVSKLTQGSWFEMDEGGKNYRCRLAAIIKATGKFIFVNRSGMKVAEESRETLAIAMKKGSLRLLDDTMLFDRALESVIGSLRESRPG